MSCADGTERASSRAFLTGSKSKEILERGLDQSRTYGDAADASVAEVRRVVELLAADGYLEISDGQYPVVGLGPRCREAAVDGFALKMKRTKKVAEGRRAHMGTFGSGRAVADLDDPAQQDLFDRLRALRKRLASEAGIAPYMVFSDRTLREMCLARPRTDEELLAISGVGAKKLRTYGEDFLAEIAAGE
jgi:ATP-dependent DNA helicase RecQ